MTSTRVMGLLICGALILAATPAAAQRPAPFERGYAHLNFGVQGTSSDVNQDSTFPVYDEAARLQTTGTTGHGALFDVGGGMRVWQRLYAGLSFTTGSNTEDAPLTASIPHPFFFDQPRTVTGTASGLKHSQQAVHLQAMWRIPVTTAFDISIGGGPTFFSVKQDMVTGITFSEVGDPTTGVTLTGVTVERVSDNPVGFHLQADGTYLLTRRFGVGGFLRYAGGNADLESADNTLDIDVGGFQIGVGGRVRF